MRGKLINKAGKGNYTTRASVENLIRYITRTRKYEKKEKELISWGTLGAPEWSKIENIINMFLLVQEAFPRKGKFGRYIDHEIYSFSEEGIKEVQANRVNLDKIAQRMANEFYREDYQVVYAIHQKDENEEKVHIHFAINTVNFETGKKRRENKTGTANREIILNAIVQEEVNDNLPSITI